MASDKANPRIIRRVLAALKKDSQKYINLERLSRKIGLYPDVLSDELVFFEPLIKFDPSIDLKPLIPVLEGYLEPPKKKEGRVREKRIVATKKELSEFSSIADFVYKKMTSAGGLVDSDFVLSDQDLHILSKLVARETARRRKERHKTKK